VEYDQSLINFRAVLHGSSIIVLARDASSKEPSRRDNIRDKFTESVKVCNGVVFVINN